MFASAHNNETSPDMSENEAFVSLRWQFRTEKKAA